MPDVTVAKPNAGAVWIACLADWLAYAAGTYTSWSYALSNVGAFSAVVVTVGLTAGGTEDHTYIAQDVIDGQGTTPWYLVNTPGWRTMPGTAIPDPLPDSTPAVDAWAAGPRSLRHQIFGAWAGASPSGAMDIDTNAAFGLTFHVWTKCYTRGMAFVTDSNGLIYGTPTIDEVEGYITDFIGGETIVASGGSGSGSGDLSPIVEALNDIALQEVDYTANCGGAVWSMRGRVVAE